VTALRTLSRTILLRPRLTLPLNQLNCSCFCRYLCLGTSYFSHCSSTLYRRRATGFGDWSINIAPRAERDLREYSRRDRRTFILVVKKMRFGYFVVTKIAGNLNSVGNFQMVTSLRRTTANSTAPMLKFLSTKQRCLRTCA
jgi:hypothetical protein